MFLQMFVFVAQSIASTSSPGREARIKASRVSKFNILCKWLLIAFCLENPLSQIAIFDGMSAKVAKVEANLCANPNWWHSNHRPNNNIASNLVPIHALWIVHCTLNSIWRGFVHYAKSTSKHPSVKLRRLIINPIFNQRKHHFSRFARANCSFTYLHKTIVEIHPQETMNNGLLSLVLSCHHLSNQL